MYSLTFTFCNQHTPSPSHSAINTLPHLHTLQSTYSPNFTFCNKCTPPILRSAINTLPHLHILQSTHSPPSCSAIKMHSPTFTFNNKHTPSHELKDKYRSLYRSLKFVFTSSKIPLYKWSIIISTLQSTLWTKKDKELRRRSITETNQSHKFCQDFPLNSQHTVGIHWQYQQTGIYIKHSQTFYFKIITLLLDYRIHTEH